MDHLSDVFTLYLDGRKARTLRSFYAQISTLLSFPDYFGKNLDALYDCLCDLSQLSADRIELHILHPEAMLSKAPADTREQVWHIFSEASDPEVRYDEKSFDVLITS
jgi:RNAse (barnase) inhibitor barstar